MFKHLYLFYCDTLRDLMDFKINSLKEKLKPRDCLIISDDKIFILTSSSTPGAPTPACTC